jgi:ATP-dependent exoDNAse (exonuclease V) beta subunit
MDFLAKEYPHKRDLCITFDEGPHIYTINGDSNYTSVTTWNHSHFEKFDADVIIGRMMNSRNWSKSKYFGQSVDEIKEGWEINRKEAAAAGTAMHLDIERYYNNIPVNNNSTEFQYFKNFEEAFPDLVPYRTEWMIWDLELKMAGSIDMIYKNEDGTISIFDWKRSKQIKKSSGNWGKTSTTPCISHIPDSNFWHYALQLNTYKAIIERNYGLKVKDLVLICLYPENKNYQYISVPNLQNEIANLFEIRKSQM